LKNQFVISTIDLNPRKTGVGQISRRSSNLRGRRVATLSPARKARPRAFAGVWLSRAVCARTASALFSWVGMQVTPGCAQMTVFFAWTSRAFASACKQPPCPRAASRKHLHYTMLVCVLVHRRGARRAPARRAAPPDRMALRAQRLRAGEKRGRGVSSAPRVARRRHQQEQQSIISKRRQLSAGADTQQRSPNLAAGADDFCRAVADGPIAFC